MKQRHITLLHNAAELEQLESLILPELAERSFHIQLLDYNQKKDRETLFALPTNTVIFTYMSDAILTEFLPFAAEYGWQIGLLPHPHMKHARQGFGIALKVGAVLDNILEREKTVSVDMMFCNGHLVLNSVMIGRHFSLSSETSYAEQRRFTGRIKQFIQQIKELRKLTLQPFHLETQKNKTLHTAALGVIVVEHGKSSVLSRRLLADSSAQDGMLHALVLAPRSLTSLIHYLFSCVISRHNKSLPDFMGHIKTNQLIIHSPKEIDYVKDGVTLCAKDIELTVQQKALKIYAGNFLTIEESGETQKENFKIRALPTGEAVRELSQHPLPWFNHSATEEFKELFLQLRESAKSSNSYLILMVISTMIATLGLHSNSTPVVIGAMILAPLMAPIISLSMGLLRQDRKLMHESLITIGRGVMLGLSVSMILSWLIPLHNLNTEISARITPNLLDLGVAITSGIAGAYAYARAEAAKSFAGVAIAVALVPPLSVSGIGLAWLDMNVFIGAMLMLLTNLTGITLASAATFTALGYSPFHLARRGLISSLAVVIAVSLPLGWSFSQMVEKSTIARQLSGMEINNIVLRDVRIVQHNPMIISADLIANQAITVHDIDIIKHSLQSTLEREIIFRTTIAYER